MTTLLLDFARDFCYRSVAEVKSQMKNGKRRGVAETEDGLSSVLFIRVDAATHARVKALAGVERARRGRCSLSDAAREILLTGLDLRESENLQKKS